MQAIRLHPAPPSKSTPYSPSNPAPPSALHLDHNLPIPSPQHPGDVVVRVHTTTVVRDMLTWPETYESAYPILGNDIAGTVAAVFAPNTSPFRPGDAVFGMAPADRAGAWAEYVLVRESDIALKPAALSFAEAAAVPLSGMTAHEALFEHGGLANPTSTASTRVDNDAAAQQQKKKKVLITGAAGAVGLYLVQLATATPGVHVVAATGSNARNEGFLRELGAHDVVQYDSLTEPSEFDLVVDVVGGQVLERCWRLVRAGGVLVSVDSASWDFVARHQERGLARDDVRASFFIVQGSRDVLRDLARRAESGQLRAFVLDTYPLHRVVEAYERANGRYIGRGKVVLTVD